jgi:hypothetical protein
MEMINDETKKTFHTWIKSHKEYMLVAGSFGRTELSRIFNRSFVSDVIRDQSITVFVAHK